MSDLWRVADRVPLTLGTPQAPVQDFLRPPAIAKRYRPVGLQCPGASARARAPPMVLRSRRKGSVPGSAGLSGPSLPWPDRAASRSPRRDIHHTAQRHGPPRKPRTRCSVRLARGRTRQTQIVHTRQGSAPSPRELATLAGSARQPVDQVNRALLGISGTPLPGADHDSSRRHARSSADEPPADTSGRPGSERSARYRLARRALRRKHIRLGGRRVQGRCGHSRAV
jgi:hypothetical protein